MLSDAGFPAGTAKTQLFLTPSLLHQRSKRKGWDGLLGQMVTGQCPMGRWDSGMKRGAGQGAPMAQKRSWKPPCSQDPSHCKRLKTLQKLPREE